MNKKIKYYLSFFIIYLLVINSNWYLKYTIHKNLNNHFKYAFEDFGISNIDITSKYFDITYWDIRIEYILSESTNTNRFERTKCKGNFSTNTLLPFYHIKVIEKCSGIEKEVIYL